MTATVLLAFSTKILHQAERSKAAVWNPLKPSQVHLQYPKHNQLMSRSASSVQLYAPLRRHRQFFHPRVRLRCRWLRCVKVEESLANWMPSRLGFVHASQAPAVPLHRKFSWGTWRSREIEAVGILWRLNYSNSGSCCGKQPYVRILTLGSTNSPGLLHDTWM